MNGQLRPGEAVLPALGVLVAATAPFAYRGRLPDPVATHWGVDGLPDGSLPLVVDHLLLTLIVLVVAFLPLWSAERVDHVIARTLVATSSALSALFAMLRWWTLEANADAPVWTEAAPMTLRGSAAVVLASALAGGFGWWAAKERPDRPVPSERAAPTPIPDGEQLVWIGGQRAMVGPSMAGLLVIVAVGLLATVPPTGPLLLGVMVAVVVLVIVTFTSIRAVIGPAGLTVRFGPLGRPRLHVPVEDIVEVRVEHVEPMAYGGWGYRVLPGVRAVVVRGGEGMRVVRRTGPDLVVTIEGAREAAGALAAQIRPSGVA
jgi:uncharacterized membrane protein